MMILKNQQATGNTEAVMGEVVVMVSPGKWVAEDQLIALKGIKKGDTEESERKYIS